MQYELTETSPRISHPENLGIELKLHQLAMIQKALDIEKENLCGSGIMNDKPGCGKSYAILGLINHTKNNFKVKKDVISNEENNENNQNNENNNNADKSKEFDIDAFNKMFNSQNNMDYCSDNSIENMYTSFSDLNNITNYDEENNINIIVVPQNIIVQWTNYIKKFGSNLKYKVITDYYDVIRMYDDMNSIITFDIILINLII